MVSTIEAKKATLVNKAAALAGQLFDPADQAAANRFIAQFYEHVPPADVAERTPRNLYGAALSLWRLGERRRPGRAKIRVHNPDPAVDGWSSPHTIVEIVNDDMPFLVDSVTGAINASNRVVHLIIHPILTVARGPDGRLCGILQPGIAGTRESWMQIEITSEADPADLARFTQTLSGVLTDARAAVTDWRPMRQVLREVAAELSAQPPPVPSAELSEAQDFLKWLDDDNFTFLGYREYFFDGAAKPQYGPLGILRDEAHSVFGGLRDLSSLPSDVQDFVRRRELLVITKSNRRGTVHRTAHMDAIGVRRFGANGGVTGVRVFLGFFTSLAYSRSSRSIPLLRLKVRRILERSGASPASHDGKALLHILDTFPRDELFQADEDQLFDTATGILNLQERQRIAVF
ncbi:MAG: NAD-glutamate dehydrogenase, partial [Alphaproteobacteria bacterium]|nr:NAD-glutamate dehydrogenase [Alphaproteobacteria bacterium]